MQQERARRRRWPWVVAGVLLAVLGIAAVAVVERVPEAGLQHRDHRPDRRAGRRPAREGEPGAQRPGDRLGHPRGRQQRRRRRLPRPGRHHHGRAPVGGQHLGGGREHPARLDGPDARLRGAGRTDRPRRAAPVQRRLPDRRAGVRAAHGRVPDRPAHRPLRRRGLRRVRRHGRCGRRGHRLHPRAHQRPELEDLLRDRLPDPRRQEGAGLRAGAQGRRRRQRVGHRPDRAPTGIPHLVDPEGDLQRRAVQPDRALRLPRRGHQVR